MDTPPRDSYGRFRLRNPTLKLLCLGLAFSVWSLAAVSKKSQSSLTLGLRLINIPAGYAVATPLPPEVRVTLYGPRAMIRAAKRANRAIVLDLAGAALTGTTTFSHLETRLRLPEEIRVTSISPGQLELRLKPHQSSQGDKHP